jgi:hypothetical protein
MLGFRFLHNPMSNIFHFLLNSFMCCMSQKVRLQEMTFTIFGKFLAHCKNAVIRSKGVTAIDDKIFSFTFVCSAINR